MFFGALLLGLLVLCLWVFGSPLFLVATQTGLSGLRNGPRSFLTSQCGILSHAAQFVQWHKHCVTTWREPRRRRTEKHICETIVSRPAATSPLILALVSHNTNWNLGGLSGTPPKTKLPSSHISLTSLHIACHR